MAKTRFTTSILKTAAKQSNTPMPWTRGSTRAATLAARKPESARKRA